MSRPPNREDVNDRADDCMKEIQACVKGIRTPSAPRICLLIELCYLLDLHPQALELSERLDRSQIEAGWLSRVDRIVRASKIKAR